MTDFNHSRASRESLRISSVEPTGWEPSLGRVPRVGDVVYCTDGPAKVVKLLGRTSDGSRLLELRCGDESRPFFASSSNVLLKAAADETQTALDDGADWIK